MTTNPTLERLAKLAPATEEDAMAAVSSEQRERLLRAIVSSDPSSSEVAARPMRRARVPARALSVAAGIALAVAAVAVIDPGEQAPGRTSDAVEATPSRAIVLDRIRLAVASADELILHVRTDHGIGVMWDNWFDATTGRARSTSSTPRGAPMYDHEFGHDENGSWVRVVSHGERAWWEYRSDRFPAHGWSAEDIRKHLDEGTLVEVAREESAGRPEIRLRWAPENAPDGIRLQPGDLWVDASTYLPSRSTANDRGRTVTMQFEWLERSSENLRFLDAPVPDGFRQLDGAPADPPGTPGRG